VADDSLSISFKLDSSEAVAGAAAFEKELNDVVAAAKKLGEVGDSPRALIRASAEATLAAEQLRAKMQAVGQPIPSGLQASLAALDTRAASAAKRAGDLKEALDNTRKAGAAASQGAEAMTGSFGSLESVFQQMKASGSDVSKSFADIGLKGVGVFAAFSAGYQVGKQLISVFKEMGVDLENITIKTERLVAIRDREGKATREVVDVYDDYGNKLNEEIGLLDPLPGKVNAVIKAHQAAAAVIKTTAGELKGLGFEWKSASGEAEKLSKATALLTTALAESEKKGEDLAATAATNASALLKLRDEYEKQGVALTTLDPKLQTAIDLAQRMKDVQESNAAAAKQLRESYGELAPVLDDVAGKTESLAEAQEREAAAMDALNKQFDRIEASQWAEKAALYGEANDRLADSFHKAKDAAQECGDAFGRVGQGLTAMNGQLDMAQLGLQGVAWEMRKATPEAHNLTEADNALIESLAKLSDSGGASSLWLGHLLAQFEAGTITLDEFQKKANDLLMGLQRINNSGFLGNLAGELNALNSLIADFKRGAGTGWPGKP